MDRSLFRLKIPSLKKSVKRAVTGFIFGRRRALAVWSALALIMGGIVGVALVQVNAGRADADMNCATSPVAPDMGQGQTSNGFFAAAPEAMDAGIDSPYGVTTIHADSRLVAEFRQLHICWVRLQIDETTIQPSPGVFDWSTLDQDVALLNAAGIHIDFPLRCFGGGCFSAPVLPTPQQMAAYATAVATRYDGQHGHGRIDAFEICNEEPDFYPPAAYGPVLQAGYLAIKSVYPNALVGMYGTYKPNLQHITAVMSEIANGYSQYLDFANFHYYAHGEDPGVSTADHPSLSAEIQTIQRILPGKPIWLTEVGWPTAPLPGMQVVSPQVQAQYLRYVMDTAASSGVVQRVFWFTLDYGNQPDAIDAQGTGSSPAFTAFQQYVQQNPGWTHSAGTSDPAFTDASTPPVLWSRTPLPVVPPPLFTPTPAPVAPAPGMPGGPAVTPTAMPTAPVPVAPTPGMPGGPEATPTPEPVTPVPVDTPTPGMPGGPEATPTPEPVTPVPVDTPTPATPVPASTPPPAPTPTPTPASTPPPMWPMP